MYIIHGEKSASWQLVAVVVGLKTMQSGKKTTQNCKNQPKIKRKIRLIEKDNFLVAVVFEFFSRYNLYIYVYIYQRRKNVNNEA